MPEDQKPKRKRGPKTTFGDLERTSVSLTKALREVAVAYAAAHGVKLNDALREAVARLGDNPTRAPRPEVIRE
jgi:hypothetical protein